VIGSRVLYQEKEYIVIHKYETGYCEIRTLNSFQVKLIHESELTFLD